MSSGSTSSEHCSFLVSVICTGSPRSHASAKRTSHRNSGLSAWITSCCLVWNATRLFCFPSTIFAADLSGEAIKCTVLDLQVISLAARGQKSAYNSLPIPGIHSNHAQSHVGMSPLHSTFLLAFAKLALYKYVLFDDAQ